MDILKDQHIVLRIRFSERDALIARRVAEGQLRIVYFQTRIGVRSTARMAK